MNTNDITLSTFGSAIAHVINYYATNYSPMQLNSFSYEALRFGVVNKVEDWNLIEEEWVPTFTKLFLDLSDNRMNSFKVALMEYSSILH